MPFPVQSVKGSSIAAVVAQIQSLAWELPYAVGVAVKKKKKKRGGGEAIQKYTRKRQIQERGIAFVRWKLSV